MNEIEQLKSNLKCQQQICTEQAEDLEASKGEIDLLKAEVERLTNALGIARQILGRYGPLTNEIDAINKAQFGQRPFSHSCGQSMVNVKELEKTVELLKSIGGEIAIGKLNDPENKVSSELDRLLPLIDKAKQ